uniref:Knottin scorpion toxin-like domain-containing protein n=1 Tax=Oryza meridionalis TaxID=40149 RepID=A0A0E0CS62_9ORYZ
MKTSQLLALLFALAVVLAAEAAPSDSGGVNTDECIGRKILKVPCQRCFSECIRSYSDGIGTCLDENTCSCAFGCGFNPPKASLPPPSESI